MKSILLSVQTFTRFDRNGRSEKAPKSAQPCTVYTYCMSMSCKFTGNTTIEWYIVHYAFLYSYLVNIHIVYKH